MVNNLEKVIQDHAHKYAYELTERDVYRHCHNQFKQETTLMSGCPASTKDYRIMWFAALRAVILQRYIDIEIRYMDEASEVLTPHFTADQTRGLVEAIETMMRFHNDTGGR